MADASCFLAPAYDGDDDECPPPQMCGNNETWTRRVRHAVSFVHRDTYLIFPASDACMTHHHQWQEGSSCFHLQLSNTTSPPPAHLTKNFITKGRRAPPVFICYCATQLPAFLPALEKTKTAQLRRSLWPKNFLSHFLVFAFHSLVHGPVEAV